MRAVSFLAGSGLRRSWRGLVIVVVLVAFAGGVTLAAFAGARRTSSSYRRFITSTPSPDVILLSHDIPPSDAPRVRAIRGVIAVARARFLALVKPDGSPLDVGFAIAGPLDDHLFDDIYRLRIVDGRDTAPGAADEVVLGEPFARLIHRGVGDTLHVASYSQAVVDQIRQGKTPPRPRGPGLRLHIVGISRAPSDLSLQGVTGGTFLLSRAFVEKYGDRIGDFYGPQGGILLVRLAD